MVRLLAERYETKLHVKLGGFWSELQTSYVSSYTEELWYIETVCLWIIIDIYIIIKFWRFLVVPFIDLIDIFNSFFLNKKTWCL